MVMKDKLVKNHHKGIYYRVRKMTLSILAGFTFAAAIIVPTYITASLKRNTTTGLAAENSKSDTSVETETETETSEESRETNYEEYNDQ